MDNTNEVKALKKKGLPILTILSVLILIFSGTQYPYLYKTIGTTLVVVGAVLSLVRNLIDIPKKSHPLINVVKLVLIFVSLLLFIEGIVFMYVFGTYSFFGAWHPTGLTLVILCTICIIIERILILVYFIKMNKLGIFNLEPKKLKLSSSSDYSFGSIQQKSIQNMFSSNIDKKRLLGMLKTHKILDINKASEILNMEPKSIQIMIYELVGEDRIEGEMIDDHHFKITSDINEFVDVIDKQFGNWNTTTKKQM